MNQVYRIVNKINGKCYIGITTQGVNRRWSEHLYRFNLGERDHKLYQAMRKYGLDNFDLLILETVKDASLLPELEIAYIKEFDSFNRGYNMTCGGDVISDETRQKLSKIFKGRKITWYDKIIATRRARGNIGGGKIWKGETPRVKSYEVKFPDGHTEVIRNLREFSRNHALDHSLMLATLKGLQRHHKGFVLLARLNDYSERKYTQASGNGGYPVALTG